MTPHRTLTSPYFPADIRGDIATLVDPVHDDLRSASKPGAEERPDTVPKNREDKRACVEFRNCSATRARAAAALIEARLEVLGEGSGHALGDVLHDARTTELRQRTGEREADFDIDPGRRAAFVLDQDIADLAASCRARARIPGAA